MSHSLWRLLGVTVVSGLLVIAEGAHAQQRSHQLLDSIEQSAEEAAREAPDPLAEDAVELVARIQSLRERRDDLEERARKASGEDRTVLEEQAWRIRTEQHAVLRSLVANILSQEKASRDVTEFREQVLNGFEAGFPKYVRQLKLRRDQVAAIREQREEIHGQERLSLESELTAREKEVQTLYRMLTEAAGYIATLGGDASEEREQLARLLSERAEMGGARVSFARQQRDELVDRIEAAPEDKDLQLADQVVHEMLDRETDNLQATISLMSVLDLETARYQQLLIETTGEIRTDQLDWEVILGLARSWTARAGELLSTRGPAWLANGFLFFAVLAAFKLLAMLVAQIASRSVKASKLQDSKLAHSTIVSWSSRTVMAIGLLVALSQLGIQIGPLLAGLGIAGFVIGFALQDTLSNFASGAMILIYRPFDLGDVIEAAGISGKVSQMSLVSTTIHTFDNQTLVVPNNKIWGDVIRNVTDQTLRRVDLEFRVGYGEDVERVEALFRDVLAKHDKVLDQPEPLIKVHELSESYVVFAVRPWVRTADYWDVNWDLKRAMKIRFEREGIEFPVEQRVVHVRPDGEP